MPTFTKIGATIGPACGDQATLEKMVNVGMSFARLNFSHGDYADHRKLIKNIRAVEKKIGQPIAIMQDLQGPKIRVGLMPDNGIAIKSGDNIILNTAIEKYRDQEIPVKFKELYKHLRIKERILIDDGRIELTVKKINANKIICVVIEGGLLNSNKGLNFPDSDLNISSITAKDEQDIAFGVKNSVDIMALSFVKSAKDILDLRFRIKKYEVQFGVKTKMPIQIIAKIERNQAVKNIKEIIEVADGIMIARGDMGLEMPAAEVPLVQKRLIDLCNASAKPVIVATQMLDSMRENRRPTRAEVSDVANAVIDHADALLLTNETAVGKFPIIVVKTMTEIISTIEQSHYDDTQIPSVRKKGTRIDTAITELARILSEEIDAKLILAASLSGETGRLISHVRPNMKILVGTSTARVQRQLNLSWGIKSFLLEPCGSIEELVERSVDYIKTQKIAKKGELMIIVAGEPVGQAGNVNLVEVREIK